jgi:hypothetical protein
MTIGFGKFGGGFHLSLPTSPTNTKKNLPPGLQKKLVGLVSTSFVTPGRPLEG